MTIELSYGGFAKFFQVMHRVKPIVENAGWVLEQALVLQTGQLFKVINIWKLHDINHYSEGLAVLASHPEFNELTALLSEVVMTETVVFAVNTPYAP